MRRGANGVGLIAYGGEERQSFVKRISLFGGTRETCGTSRAGWMDDGSKFEVFGTSNFGSYLSRTACVSCLQFTNDEM